MFSFHKVTLADKDWMQPLLFHDGWSGSEYTFGTNILWGVKYHIEACKSRRLLYRPLRTVRRIPLG